jgi:serine/threonine-protein kinase
VGISEDDTLAEDSPPPARAARLTLGAYEVGAKIGQGGMGEVLLARDTKIGREVAVKRLLSAEPSSDAVARFLREAQIQARLDHPSIVPVHELGEDKEGRPYFTMKRLAGVTLAQRLADPAADTRALLNAFVDVCAAIELAHTRRVVHRDLKPANIMLGDFREVYVLDWGVARVLGESASEASAASASVHDAETQAGTVIGTPMYMAPEQARGEPAGPAADVFALGAILFEILAREPLRAAGDLDPAETSPARRRPERAIAPELDAACQAALAAAADARPTAHELGERVQRYLDGDRDLEARRALAADHLARAREALAADDRAGAMQAAGRALGLDPDSDAASLIGSLLVEPPREMPADFEADLARLDAGLMQSQARNAGYAMAAFFLWAPFFAFLHVTSWPTIGAMFAVLAVSSAIVLRSARQEQPDNRLIFVTQSVVLVLMARIFSPFVIVPTIVALFTTGWSSFPPRLDHPVRTLALACLGPAVAIALELTGLVSRTWHLGEHSITFTSAAFDMSSHVTEVLLGTSLFGALIVGGLFTRRMAIERRAALRKVELQAWHLRKLVGR